MRLFSFGPSTPLTRNASPDEVPDEVPGKSDAMYDAIRAEGRWTVEG
jgi:hypothetical protein